MPSLLRTHTDLQPAQWRMLRALHRVAPAPVVDVPAWLRRWKAFREELVDLVNRGLAEQDGEPGGDGAVSLTAAGGAMVDHSLLPCWEALAMLDGRGSRGAKIPDVLRHSMDVSIFDGLFAKGWTEMRSCNGEPVLRGRPSWDEVSRIGKGQNWPGITVHITGKGRTYL